MGKYSRHTVLWKRKNKFNAKASRVDGNYFASKGECSLYSQLKLREAAGEVKDILCQPSFSLTKADITWKVDFQYFCLRTNQYIAAEYKGVETSDYRIKKKLWGYYGKMPLEIYKGHYNSVHLVETIIPK